MPIGAGAGDAGERDENHVFADVAVVADVDEVVEFCAAADASFFQRAAVDGAVGADLDVVFYHQCSLLRELRVGAGGGIAHVAETVCAEHDAGVHHDAIADCRAGVNHDARIDAAVLADAHACADDGAGFNAGSRANFSSLADDGTGGDGYVRV